MDELERRLRQSLEARSDDLEATPALWNEVQRRAVRRRRRGFLIALSGAAAAVIVAVVAVPALLDLRETDAPQIFVEPSETPTESEPDEGALPGTEPAGEPSPTDVPTTSEPGAVTVGPEWAVGTDGFDVFLLRDGERDALLVEGPAEEFREDAEARIVAVAVRPGSTPDELTGVLLEEGEGMFALRWFRWSGGGSVDDAQFPDEYQIQDMRTDGAVPNPVWSPDGGHLAWLEGGEGGPFSVRAIQWTEGPGSDDDRNDDAGFGVDVALSFGARLQEWTWVADDGTTATGQWVITDPLSGGDGGSSLVAYPVERQGDGALAIPDPNAPYLQPDQGSAYLDIANGHVGFGEEDVRFFLTVDGGGEGAVDLLLTAVQASDQSEDLPVPEDIEQTSDPTSIWMTAGGDAVFVGSGGRAWISARDGSLVMLDTTVWHAAFILP